MFGNGVSRGYQIGNGGKGVTTYHVELLEGVGDGLVLVDRIHGLLELLPCCFLKVLRYFGCLYSIEG